ncbi:MAG: hypothetical protein O7G87_01530 [bacterium]|nr:hypothetical protein [bacterium]
MTFGNVSHTGGIGEPGFGPMQKDQQQKIRFQNTLAAARAAEVDRVEISGEAGGPQGMSQTSAELPVGANPESSLPAQKILTRLNRVMNAYQPRPDSGLDIVR